jgi:Xaa-Pro aminopeptidase
MNPAAAATRLARYRDALAAAGLGGAVVSRPENVFYLTGVAASTGRPTFAVVGPERTAVVAPSGATPWDDTIAAFAYGTPGLIFDRIVDVDQESAIALRTAFDYVELQGTRLGIEEMAISAHNAGWLAAEATLSVLHDEVEVLRRRKDPAELRLIEEAIRCNEAGFAAALEVIRPGATELEVYLAVAAAVQQAAGSQLALNDGNHGFVSGPRTTLAAGPATNRRLEPGDLMIIDLNPVIHNYKGDLTRTFCVGGPTSAQRALHEAVVRALEVGAKAGRPGARGRDVDAAMREILTATGYGAGLITHFGHGLGLQHLERPYIIPAEEHPLEEGMVIALEPGVYLPGELGLRVEDNFVVTPQGMEPLSHFPRELFACK